MIGQSIDQTTSKLMAGIAQEPSITSRLSATVEEHVNGRRLCAIYLVFDTYASYIVYISIANKGKNIL